MVKLTASEELLSSPDRRSLRQKKLAERFMNSVVIDEITVENTEEVKSESSSSGEENQAEEDKLDVQIDK